MNNDSSGNDQYFHQILDSSPAMMWVTRPDGYCTYLSKQWYDFTGRDFEQDLGLGWVENLHPEDREAAGVEFMRCSNQQIDYEVVFRLLHKNGQYRWVMDKGNPRFGDSGEFLGFVGLVIDVHEKKLAESALEEMSDRFLRVATATDLGVWYCNLPFDVLNWSDEVKNHFWLPRDTQISMELFYNRIHPEDREKTAQAINKSITEHTPYQIDYRTTNPQDESQIKWIRAIGWTDYDKDNNAIHFDGITLDVSEEIELQRNLKEALLVRDEFLSVASHELKTPLTTLLLQSQILGQIVDKETQVDEKLKSISDRTIHQVKRLTRLVEDMVDISRIRTGKLELQKENTNMEQIVSDVINQLASEFKKNNTPLPEVIVKNSIEGFWDAMRVEQVLNNLVINALRYGKHSQITITCENVGNLARVIVKDQGIGIKKEAQEKIFNRFERAVPANEVAGLGLGLYISKQIIESHQGSIRVESAPGAGSSFIIEMPLKA